jgi:hypothetical protein
MLILAQDLLSLLTPSVKLFRSDLSLSFTLQDFLPYHEELRKLLVQEQTKNAWIGSSNTLETANVRLSRHISGLYGSGNNRFLVILEMMITPRVKLRQTGII